MKSITELIKEGAALGDGGYLIELERRGYVDNGSRREKVGTGRGSGQFTPEVVIENPDALRELHREFLDAGSNVLQALTFFGTREKLGRAGYGTQTESINTAAVKLAREVAGDRALVAGSVSRTQLTEREGMESLGKSRDHLAEQIRLLKDAGVDFLILETFFHLAEMRVALECANEVGLPAVATMSFRPLVTHCTDGFTPAECARQLADLGAIAVGANCEQNPKRMMALLREMRAATSVPLAAQPAAFRTTDECHSFTRLPAFPNDLETIQVARSEFQEFGSMARGEGIGFLGGCCGANAAYIRALAEGAAAYRPHRPPMIHRSIHPTAGEADAAAADTLAGWLTAPGVRSVMVAAGNTPLELYRRVGDRGLPLSHLEIFALDEYVGVPLGEPRNCSNLLRRTVAAAWGVPPQRFHGISSLEADAVASARAHEAKIAAAGGLDVVVLGLGQNGHLGFNEPGSAEDSAGRLLDLEPVSIEANRSWFGGAYAPAKGVTAGLRTVLAARRIMILAYGTHKAAAVKMMIDGPRGALCPASFLQTHPAAHAFLDAASAAALAPPS